jgi:hypothetical protein
MMTAIKTAQQYAAREHISSAAHPRNLKLRLISSSPSEEGIDLIKSLVDHVGNFVQNEVTSFIDLRSVYLGNELGRI